MGTSEVNCSETFRCLCARPLPIVKRYYGPVKSGTCEDVGLRTIVDNGACVDAGRQVFPGQFSYAFFVPSAGLDSNAGGCWPTADQDAFPGSLCVNTKTTSPVKCSEEFQCVCEVPKPQKRYHPEPITSGTCEDHGFKTILDFSTCVEGGTQVFPGQFPYTFLVPNEALDANAAGCWPTPDQDAFPGSLCLNTKTASPEKCSEKFKCICLE